MQIGLTAFMVALVASWSERKATALTTQQCALVPVDRTSLAHDMERSAFYTRSGRVRSCDWACNANGHTREGEFRYVSSLLGGPAKRESPRYSDYANPACLGN